MVALLITASENLVRIAQDQFCRLYLRFEEPIARIAISVLSCLAARKSAATRAKQRSNPISALSLPTG